MLDHLEQGEVVDVIYTDFSKAFDKWETIVLLHTLRECGVKGRVGLWISSFLDPKTRKQAVELRGESPLFCPWYQVCHRGLSLVQSCS